MKTIIFQLKDDYKAFMVLIIILVNFRYATKKKLFLGVFDIGPVKNGVNDILILNKIM